MISILLFTTYMVGFLIAVERGGLKGAFGFFYVTFPFTVFVAVGSVNVSSVELASLLAVFVFLAASTRRGEGITLYWPLTHYTPFLAYATASLLILFTSSPTPRALVHVGRPIAYLVLAVIGMQVVQATQGTRRLLQLASYGVLTALAIGVVEAAIVRGFADVVAWKATLSHAGILPVTLEDQELIYGWSSLEGVSGVFPLHHPYAYFLGVVALFLFSRLLHSSARSVGRTALEASLLFLSIMLLALTQSRTFQLALLPALAMGLVVMPTGRLLRRMGTVALLGLLILAAVTIPEVRWERLAAAVTLVTGDPGDWSDGSVAARLDYHQRSIALIRQHPILGAGFDSFGAGTGQSKPHNAYLTEWQMKGVFGLAGYLLVIGVLFVSGWSGYRQRRPEPALFHFAVVLSVYVAVAGLGSAVLGDVRAGLPLIFAYVTIHALTREARAREERLSTRLEMA